MGLHTVKDDDEFGWAITAMIVMCVAVAIGAFLGLVLSP